MTGVLLVAHGSLLHPDSSEPARKLLPLLRDLERFDEVRVAFWKEQPSYREALLTMASEEIVVVPLFISEGYFSRTIVPRELGLAGRITERAERTLRYAEPVGTHRSMTHVVLRRAQEALKRGRIPRKDSALVLVGHGTKKHKNSADSIHAQVDILQRTSGFGEVRALFIDEAPYIDQIYKEVAAKQIVVVPYFISDGLHTREDIPSAIGLGSAVATDTVALGLVDGRRVLYTSAVGTDGTLVEVVVARIEEALSQDGPAEAGEPDTWLDSLTPTLLKNARDRFLNTLKRSNELVLGELIVEAQGAEGFFRILHEKDRGLAGLRNLKSIEALDELCHTAQDDSYRPLRFRADLTRGWKIKPVEASDLFDALEALYPAGVALRFADLEPVLWEDAAARHSGALASLQELDQSAARRAAHAACGGLGCLRQPLWLEEPIDTGAKSFACAETCALMNAFALRIQKEEEQAPVAGGEAVSMLSEQARTTVETALRAMRRRSTTNVADFDNPENPAWITYLLARHYGWKD